ncbi:MAG: sensor hybrid histidine kinase [Bryobacterales bacterium]|nr:sensor hybrid histidine kinase [Bryobacterales bacterium]
MAAAKRILVIDDDHVFLRQVNETLAEAGYGVLEAVDGTAALALLKKVRYHVDLIITDLVLPGSSGHNIIAEVSGRDATIKIIATTGVLNQTQLEITKYLGADAVLRKPEAGAPFPGSELLQTVRTLLANETALGDSAPT